MNITFVLPAGAGLGGVTTWSIEMVRQLAAVGQASCLLEHVNPTTDYQIQVPPGVRLVRHYGHRPTHLYPGDIYKYLSTYQKVLPGLIIPNYTWGTYAACAAVAREQAHQLRVIGFAHTDEAYYYDFLCYYEPIIHLFVAVSQEVAEALKERIPHRHGDILVRPYGVEVAGSLSRTYSPPHEPIQLVYAGRLVEYQKKVSALVTLAEALVQRQVDFRLRIIGEGEEKDTLQQRVRYSSQSIHERVCIEGRLSHRQMLDVWRSADICVLASEYEGTSIAMLEAMACGCVPVVTRVSGTSAVVTPGENGYFVEVGDMAEMVRIIQRLAVERDEVARLGFGAHRTVLDRFSLPAYVDWLLTTACKVWEQPSRPWPSRRAVLPFRALFRSVWMALLAPAWRTKRFCQQVLRRVALLVNGKSKAAAIWE